MMDPTYRTNYMGLRAAFDCFDQAALKDKSLTLRWAVGRFHRSMVDVATP
jgi:hypothetical protein